MNKKRMEEIFNKFASPTEKLAYSKLKESKDKSTLELAKIKNDLSILKNSFSKSKKEEKPELTGLKILEKLNNLAITPEEQFDFTHIKNFPWHLTKNQTTSVGENVPWGGYGAYDLNLKSITLGQITSNQNNYATGLGSWFRISSSAAYDITGFENGTDGRGFLITNVGSFAITLKNQSASSGAINRILTESGSDLILSANDTAWILYDATTERWRATIHSAGGSETLAQTLALGNVTGGTDIVVSTGDKIKGQTSLTLQDSTGNNYYFASSTYLFQQWYDGLGAGNTDFLLQGNGTQLFSHTSIDIQTDTGLYGFFSGTGTNKSGIFDFTNIATSNKTFTFPNTSGTVALSTTGIWTVAGNDIYNSNSGNVGINTVTPLARFHVTGDMQVDGIGGSSLYFSDGSMIWTTQTNQASAALNISMVGATTGGNPITISTNSDVANHAAIYISHSGATGIGLDVPTAKRGARLFGTLADLQLVSGKVSSTVANGGSAIAYALNTTNTFTTTALLLSLKNNGTQKFAVQQDGSITYAYFDIQDPDTVGSPDTRIAYVKNGSSNTILGWQTARPSSLSGTQNTLIGNGAGNGMTSGNSNTAVGFQALVQNQTCEFNVAIGIQSLYSLAAGGAGVANNVGIGRSALMNTVTGYDNMALGTNAGYWNLTGFRNAYMGTNAGLQSLGSYNIAFGFQSGRISAGTYNYSIALGTEAVYTADHQLVIGGGHDDGGGGIGQITDAYIGSGVTDTTPFSITINATGGSGSNVAGASMILAGGKGTGTGTPGPILFKTSSTTGSGSTLQTLSTRMTLSSYVSDNTYNALSLNASTAAGDYNILSGNGADKNLYINRPSGMAINFSENAGTYQMVISTGGNIGIGTSSPSQHLELYTGAFHLNRANITSTQESAPGAPTVATGVAGALTGAYYYKITFLTASGETGAGTASLVVNPVAQKVNLSSIPTGTAGVVTQRGIYRTKAGGSTWFFVAYLADNVTTTYTDNTADGSLGVISPAMNTTAGAFLIGSQFLFVSDQNTGNSIAGYQAGNGFRDQGGSTAFGFQSAFNSNGAGSTYIGFQAGIGNDVYTSNPYLGIFIGYRSGYSLTTGGTRSIYITANSSGTTTGQQNTIIGIEASGGATDTNSIGIGYAVATTASNQLVIGGNTGGGIVEGYIGNGVTATSPQDFTLNASGGSGSNIAGANLLYASGKGTGNAAGGDHIWKTSDAGGSGSTLQTLTEKMRLSVLGVLTLNSVVVPTISSTSTLTNKRITQRVVTTTDDATAVIDVDVTDVYELSAVANATTFSTTGTPTNGQKLRIRFKDAGVGKGLTWDGVFVAIGVTLPTTTVAGKWHYVDVTYNTAAGKWHALLVNQEA